MYEFEYDYIGNVDADSWYMYRYVRIQMEFHAIIDLKPFKRYMRMR